MASIAAAVVPSSTRTAPSADAEAVPRLAVLDIFGYNFAVNLARYQNISLKWMDMRSSVAIHYGMLPSHPTRGFGRISQYNHE